MQLRTIVTEIESRCRLLKNWNNPTVRQNISFWQRIIIYLINHSFIQAYITQCAETETRGSLTHLCRSPHGNKNNNNNIWSIISELILPSGRKLSFGILATTTLESFPFLVYPLFPSLLLISKYFLNFVFCEGFQHPLRTYLCHINCAKMAESFIGKTGRKSPSLVSRVYGGWQSHCYSPKFADE